MSITAVPLFEVRERDLQLLVVSFMLLFGEISG
jgi:hypothetical protein